MILLLININKFIILQTLIINLYFYVLNPLFIFIILISFLKFIPFIIDILHNYHICQPLHLSILVHHLHFPIFQLNHIQLTFKCLNFSLRNYKYVFNLNLH